METEMEDRAEAIKWNCTIHLVKNRDSAIIVF
jgi:hypothetical protein